MSDDPFHRNDNCARMLSIATSPYIWTALVYNTIMCIIACPLLIYSMRKVYSQKLFHVNTRIIIVVHFAALFGHCAIRIPLHLIDLDRYLGAWSNLSGCELLPNVYRCFSMRLPYSILQAFANFSFITVLLERWIATWQFEKYEKSTKWVAVGLIGVQGFLTFCMWFPITYNYQFSRVSFYCSVVSYSASMMLLVIPQGIVVVLQVSATFGFHRLVKINSKRRTVMLEKDLSTRYQVAENIRSNQILQTFATVGFSQVIPSVLFSGIVHYFHYYIPDSIYFALIETVNFIPTYSVYMPFVLWRRDSQVYEEAKNKIASDLKRAMENNDDIYFAQLRAQLAGPN